MKDNWHYPRTDLAKKILDGMEDGLLDRVTLFAPRKSGKTQFILRDVSPMAKDADILPIYVDFWIDKINPEQAFINSVITALKDNEDLIQKLKHKFSIKKLAVGAAGIKFEIESNETQKPTLIEVFNKLNTLNIPILLLLDEIQHLATKNEFEPFTAALRSFIVNRGDNRVKGIFTGSSQLALRKMFDDSGAAFFGSAQKIDFEALGEDFVRFELDTFKAVTNGITLDEQRALDILEKQRCKPARFVELLKRMALNQCYDLNEAVQQFDEPWTPNEIAVFKDKRNNIKSLGVALIQLICTKPSFGIYTEESFNQLKKLTKDEVNKNNVKTAIDKLKTHEIIYSSKRGHYEILDVDFVDYLNEEMGLI